MYIKGYVNFAQGVKELFAELCPKTFESLKWDYSNDIGYLSIEIAEEEEEVFNERFFVKKGDPRIPTKIKVK